MHTCMYQTWNKYLSAIEFGSKYTICTGEYDILFSCSNYKGFFGESYCTNSTLCTAADRFHVCRFAKVFAAPFLQIPRKDQKKRFSADLLLNVKDREIDILDWIGYVFQEFNMLSFIIQI